MHNRKGFKRLGRKSSHRKALERNMVTSLIKHERLETTKAKAKQVSRKAEKLVTRAKVDSVHNRRIVSKTVYDQGVVNKLFTEISPRFKERPGGYTRILKVGQRQGDAAEVVVLEFVTEELKVKKKKKPAKKAAAPQKEAPAEEKVEAPVEDAKAETTAEETKETADE